MRISSSRAGQKKKFPAFIGTLRHISDVNFSRTSSHSCDEASNTRNVTHRAAEHFVVILPAWLQIKGMLRKRARDPEMNS